MVQKQLARKGFLYKNLAMMLMIISAVFIAKSNVMISEVCVNPNDKEFPWVELVNNSSNKAEIAGYQLSGSAKYVFTGKAASLTPGQYIVVMFDGKSGVDSKMNSLFIHAPLISDKAFSKKGELAFVSSNGVESYISWGDQSESIYKSNAIKSGVWQYVDHNLSSEEHRVGPGKSLKKGGTFVSVRDEKGNTTGRWEVKSPEAVSIGGPSGLSSPNLYVPSDGVQITSIPGEQKIKLVWYKVPECKKYRLLICNDINCLSITKDSYINSDYYEFTDFANNSVFYWKIAGIDASGNQTPWSEVRKVTVGYPGQQKVGAVTEEKVLGVPALAARKDTRLLCLDTWHGDITDGCDLNNTVHPWNASHVSATHYCECGSWRCWAVGATMMNRYYRGTVSIDEVKFNIKGGGVPEDDFPHGSAGGASYQECRNADAWALQITTAQLNVSNTKPTEANIRAFINANRPIYWIDGGHVMVLDGFRVNGGIFEIRMLNTDNDGTIQWRTLSSQVFAEYHCPAFTGTTGRTTDPMVSTDSDGDGMMDFDEINRFLTDRNNPDSDIDGINDRIEVFSYSQARELDHTLLDQDGDGKRAERDFNSDGGTKPDGYEDLNSNGIKDSLESDVFLASDDGTIPNDLVISSVTLSSKRTFLAKNSITIGPSVVINSPADIIFSAGNTVKLNSGITQNSGIVKTKVDPNLK